MKNHCDIGSHWDSVTGLFFMRLFSATNPTAVLSIEKKQQSNTSCLMYDQQSYKLKTVIFTLVDKNKKLIIISIKFFWKMLIILSVCLSSDNDGIQIMSMSLI